MIIYLIPLALLITFLVLETSGWWRRSSQLLQDQNDAVLADIDLDRWEQGR